MTPETIDYYYGWYQIQSIYFESMMGLGLSIDTIDKVLKELNDAIAKD